MTKIKVAIKLRPLIDRELSKGKCVFWDTSPNTIFEIDPSTEKSRNGSSYCFDHVFGVDSTNEDVYNTAVQPLVERVVDGFNATVFAYGQTSSGKTFTMLGDKTQPGIIPLTISWMFKTMEQSAGRQFLVRVSYMEIYNEQINDLLAKNENLMVREDEGKVIVVDLKEEVVATVDKVMALIKKGEKNRRIAETNMNERSSRSHTIFRLIVESRDGHATDDDDQVIKVAHLNLVDLAGSERVNQTGNKVGGERFKEGCAINRSLFMLSLVIQKLSDGSETYINYRNSKLTRILQSSLGGNALTVIVCAVTAASLEETHSTLGFASRARNIKNKPEVNEVMSDGTLLKRYASQIKKLKSEMEKLKGTGLSVEEMESKLLEKDQMNIVLQERIDRLSELLIGYSESGTTIEVNRNKRRMTWCAPQHIQYSLKPVIQLPFQNMYASNMSSNAIQLNDEDFCKIPFEQFEKDLLEEEIQKSSDTSSKFLKSGHNKHPEYKFSPIPEEEETFKFNESEYRSSQTEEFKKSTRDFGTQMEIMCSLSPDLDIIEILDSPAHQHQKLAKSSSDSVKSCERIEKRLSFLNNTLEEMKPYKCPTDSFIRLDAELTDFLDHQNNDDKIFNLRKRLPHFILKLQSHLSALKNEIENLNSVSQSNLEIIDSIRRELVKEISCLSPTFDSSSALDLCNLELLQTLLTCIMEKEREIILHYESLNTKFTQSEKCKDERIKDLELKIEENDAQKVEQCTNEAAMANNKVMFANIANSPNLIEITTDRNIEMDGIFYHYSELKEVLQKKVRELSNANEEIKYLEEKCKTLEENLSEYQNENVMSSSQLHHGERSTDCCLENNLTQKLNLQNEELLCLKDELNNLRNIAEDHECISAKLKTLQEENDALKLEHGKIGAEMAKNKLMFGITANSPNLIKTNINQNGEIDKIFPHSSELEIVLLKKESELSNLNEEIKFLEEKCKTLEENLSEYRNKNVMSSSQLHHGEHSTDCCLENDNLTQKLNLQNEELLCLKDELNNLRNIPEDHECISAKLKTLQEENDAQKMKQCTNEAVMANNNLMFANIANSPNLIEITTDRNIEMDGIFYHYSELKEVLQKKVRELSNANEEIKYLEEKCKTLEENLSEYQNENVMSSSQLHHGEHSTDCCLENDNLTQKLNLQNEELLCLKDELNNLRNIPEDHECISAKLKTLQEENYAQKVEQCTNEAAMANNKVMFANIANSPNLIEITTDRNIEIDGIFYHYSELKEVLQKKVRELSNANKEIKYLEEKCKTLEENLSEYQNENVMSSSQLHHGEHSTECCLENDNLTQKLNLQNEELLCLKDELNHLRNIPEDHECISAKPKTLQEENYAQKVEQCTNEAAMANNKVMFANIANSPNLIEITTDRNIEMDGIFYHYSELKEVLQKKVRELSNANEEIKILEEKCKTLEENLSEYRNKNVMSSSRLHHGECSTDCCLENDNLTQKLNLQNGELLCLKDELNHLRNIAEDHECISAKLKTLQEENDALKLEHGKSGAEMANKKLMVGITDNSPNLIETFTHQNIEMVGIYPHCSELKEVPQEKVSELSNAKEEIRYLHDKCKILFELQNKSDLLNSQSYHNEYSTVFDGCVTFVQENNCLDKDVSKHKLENFAVEDKLRNLSEEVEKLKLKLTDSEMKLSRVSDTLAECKLKYSSESSNLIAQINLLESERRDLLSKCTDTDNLRQELQHRDNQLKFLKENMINLLDKCYKLNEKWEYSFTEDNLKLSTSDNSYDSKHEMQDKFYECKGKQETFSQIKSSSDVIVGECFNSDKESIGGKQFLGREQDTFTVKCNSIIKVVSNLQTTIAVISMKYESDIQHLIEKIKILEVERDQLIRNSSETDCLKKELLQKNNNLMVLAEKMQKLESVTVDYDLLNYKLQRVECERTDLIMKVKKYETKICEMNDKMSNVELCYNNEVDSIHKKVGTLEEEKEQLLSRCYEIDCLKLDLQKKHSDLVSARSEIDHLKQLAVEIDILKKSLQIAENDNLGLQTKIQTNENVIASLQNNFYDLEVSHKKEIAILKKKITMLENDINRTDLPNELNFINNEISCNEHIEKLPLAEIQSYSFELDHLRNEISNFVTFHINKVKYLCEKILHIDSDKSPLLQTFSKSDPLTGDEEEQLKICDQEEETREYNSIDVEMSQQPLQNMTDDKRAIMMELKMELICEKELHLYNNKISILQNKIKQLGGNKKHHCTYRDLDSISLSKLRMKNDISYDQSKHDISQILCDKNKELIPTNCEREVIASELKHTSTELMRIIEAVEAEHSQEILDLKSFYSDEIFCLCENLCNFLEENENISSHSSESSKLAFIKKIITKCNEYKPEIRHVKATAVVATQTFDNDFFHETVHQYYESTEHNDFRKKIVQNRCDFPGNESAKNISAKDGRIEKLQRVLSSPEEDLNKFAVIQNDVSCDVDIDSNSENQFHVGEVGKLTACTSTNSKEIEEMQRLISDIKANFKKATYAKDQSEVLCKEKGLLPSQMLRNLEANVLEMNQLTDDNETIQKVILLNRQMVKVTEENENFNQSHPELYHAMSKLHCTEECESKNQIQKMKIDIQDKNKQIEQLMMQVSMMRENLRQLEILCSEKQEMAKLAYDLETKTFEVAQMDNENEMMCKEIQCLQKTIDKLTEENESLEHKLLEQRVSRDETETLLIDNEEKKKTIEQLNSHIFLLDEKLKQENVKNSQLEMLCSEKQEMISKLAYDLETKTIEVAQMDNENEMMCKEIQCLQKTIDKLTEENESLEHKLLEQRVSRDETETLLIDNEEKKKTIEQLNSHNFLLDEKLKQENVKNSQLEMLCSEKQEMISKLAYDLETKTIEVAQMDDENEMVCKEIQCLQKTIDKLTKENESLEHKLLEKCVSRDEIETLLADNQGKKKTIEQLNSHNFLLDEKLKQENVKTCRLEMLCSDKQEMISKLAYDLETKTIEVAQMDDENEMMCKEIQYLQKSIDKLTKENESLEQKLSAFPVQNTENCMSRDETGALLVDCEEKNKRIEQLNSHICLLEGTLMQEKIKNSQVEMLCSEKQEMISKLESDLETKAFEVAQINGEYEMLLKRMEFKQACIDKVTEENNKMLKLQDLSRDQNNESITQKQSVPLEELCRDCIYLKRQVHDLEKEKMCLLNGNEKKCVAEKENMLKLEDKLSKLICDIEFIRKQKSKLQNYNFQLQKENRETLNKYRELQKRLQEKFHNEYADGPSAQYQVGNVAVAISIGTNTDFTHEDSCQHKDFEEIKHKMRLEIVNGNCKISKLECNNEEQEIRIKTLEQDLSSSKSKVKDLENQLIQNQHRKPDADRKFFHKQMHNKSMQTDPGHMLLMSGSGIVTEFLADRFRLEARHFKKKCEMLKKLCQHRAKKICELKSKISKCSNCQKDDTSSPSNSLSLYEESAECWKRYETNKENILMQLDNDRSTTRERNVSIKSDSGASTSIMKPLDNPETFKLPDS